MSRFRAQSGFGGGGGAAYVLADGGVVERIVQVHDECYWRVERLSDVLGRTVWNAAAASIYVLKWMSGLSLMLRSCWANRRAYFSPARYATPAVGRG
jgi:hypothetical protein